MSTLFVTLITIVFIAESFWEFRLFSQLSSKIGEINNQSEKMALAKALRLDRRWNWASWILILLIFIAPSAYYLPLVALLCLLETLMVMRMDRVKVKYLNS